MSFRVHVKQSITLEHENKEITLVPNVYIINDKKFCKENFLQCSKCHEFFDEINEFMPFHHLYIKHQDKQYCSKCFSSLE